MKKDLVTIQEVAANKEMQDFLCVSQNETIQVNLNNLEIPLSVSVGT